MLEVNGLRKAYGEGPDAHVAIDRLDLTVHDGEFVCLVGPSGCGKTTLLRCLSGLMPPTEGKVTLSGTPVTEPPDELAFVFQDFSRSLLPWMSVEGNVTFPLQYNGVPKERRRAVAQEALESVGLAGAAGRYPWQLSGGMQQRVALARAIAYRPRIFLMDEPFASVDAQTRADLEDLTLRLRTELGLTVLLVTHDIDEAIYLADRVVALSTAPSRVEAEYDVPLPVPRDQIETKNHPDFGRLRAHVFGVVRGRGRDESAAQRAPNDDRGAATPRT